MDQFIDPKTLLTGTGAVTLLSIAIMAFYKEWIVPGSVHRRDLAERDARIVILTAERDRFLQLSIRATNVADATQRARGGGYITTLDTPPLTQEG